jgi:hypothetical protein
MPKLRLVKVYVQPVFNLDHGTHLEEIVEAPKEIPAKDWPGYSNGQFMSELAATQKQLDAAEPKRAVETKPRKPRKHK